MSKIIPKAATGNVLLSLVVMAILSTPASAVDPNKPSDPNALPRPTALRSSRPGAEVSAKTIPPGQAEAPLRFRPVPPMRRGSASLTQTMPVSEAIEILRNATTPPLNIVVLWRDLGENAGIYRDTPIGFDGVPGLSVGQCLDLLTASLSAGASAKLGYVVRNGAIIVATTDHLPPSPMITRVYDVSDLTAEPARYFMSPFGFGGMGYGGYGGMMGPTGGYGGTFGGYGPGASYLPGNSYGASSLNSLSGFVGSTYGAPRYPGR